MQLDLVCKVARPAEVLWLAPEADAANGDHIKGRIKKPEETIARMEARLAEIEPIINALK